jgi:spore coat protein U-like protein
MKRVILMLAALLLAVTGAQAAAVCTVTASGVAFGSFNPLPAQSADTTGTIAVNCTGTAGDIVSYTITIDAGLGSFTRRTMVSGTDSLNYNLYRDSGCMERWGDGSPGTYTVSGSITLSSSTGSVSHIVYSRIASGQNTAKAHTYSDNLVVTLTY